jgi:hypothetical protein
MKNSLKFNPGSILLIVLSIGLLSIGFTACESGGESSSNEAVTTEIDDATAQQSDKPITVKQTSLVPKGWKTYKFEGWSISFPSNWGGDEDKGVWWPGEGSMDRGRPALSVHTGGTPLMPNRSFEDKVRSHMNSEPLTKEAFSSSGFSGLKCTWESYGKKYLGVFLEEKVGGGVSIIHFVNCQAPAADFNQYKDDFEKIVSTFSR